MKLETLVALLAIGIPAINIIIPVINNIINFFLTERKSKIEYERNNKDNSLNNFLNSIIDYCRRPTEPNKNICNAYLLKLCFNYKIKKKYDFNDFIDSEDNVDFDELNRFLKSIE